MSREDYSNISHTPSLYSVNINYSRIRPKVNYRQKYCDQREIVIKFLLYFIQKIDVGNKYYLFIISHSMLLVCFRLKRNFLGRVNIRVSSLIPKVRNTVQVIVWGFELPWLLDTTRPGPYLLG